MRTAKGDPSSLVNGSVRSRISCIIPLPREIPEPSLQETLPLSAPVERRGMDRDEIVHVVRQPFARPLLSGAGICDAGVRKMSLAEELRRRVTPPRVAVATEQIVQKRLRDIKVAAGIGT